MIEAVYIHSVIDSILNKLKKHGRIDEDYIGEFNKNFENQSLQIGVVGKMKAGKSSLVNAFVFGDNTLPTGSEPITVTLTEITYGKESSVEVELLSSEDIDQLKLVAQYQGEDETLMDRANNAREALCKFPANLNVLIGDGIIHNIQINELADYISTSGKYSGLAKVVRITINDSRLKGLTIVDTPGYNDPVSSRGETTKERLSQCNVILFVHNQDGYDQTDVALLKDQIGYAGISELVDIYNKVDILHIPLSEWNDQLEYLNDKRTEYIKDLESEGNLREIISSSCSVLSSSLMALCGMVDVKNRTDFLKKKISLFEEEFKELSDTTKGESVAQLLVKYSNINQIVDNINRIAKNRVDYLKEAPLLTLKGKLDAVVDVVTDEINDLQSEMSLLQVGYNTAKQDLDDFEKFMRAMKNQINANTLESDLHRLISNLSTQLKQIRYDSAEKEFTIEKYKELHLGSKKGKRRYNISLYNNFVLSFENIIRDNLQRLLQDIKGEVQNNTNNMVAALINQNISQELRNRFNDGVSKQVGNILNSISIIVEPHNIDEVPKKVNQYQWSLYKTYFLNAFNDIYIEGLLAPRHNEATEVGNGDILKAQLNDIYQEIRGSMSFTPAQKEEKIKKCTEKMCDLKDEMVEYQGMLKDLLNLIDEN